jgi:hypothetical protein
MQHHLGDTASQEYADRRMTNWTVRQGVDETRNLAVEVGPVFDRGSLDASMESNRGSMK